MQAEVYIDLYFLINTSMNLLCLMITASLLHKRINRLRAALGAAIGALYAVASLLLGMGGWTGLIADCGAALLMCTVAFFEKGLGTKRLLQCTAVQVLSSMVLGGIMTALYTLLNRLDLPLETLKGESLSIWTVAALGIAAAFATVRGGRLFGFSQKTKSVTVRAILFDKEITLRALVDTGNLLKEPISGRSVIVAREEQIYAILPKELSEALKSPFAESWISDPRYASRIRVIPTRTATGARMMLALVPDSLSVTEHGSTYSANYLIAPAPLGENAKGFDAIIAAT